MNIGQLIAGLSVLGLYPPGSGGGGSVTNVGTGTGLTGGPIITSGVISLAPINTQLLLANLTGSSAAPLPHSMSAILDYTMSSAQGSILYRSASAWSALPPPVATNLFLRSGGAAANPVWDIPVAGGFDPAQTIYFAPIGGSDSNPGTDAQPFQTLAAAVTAAQVIISGGTPGSTFVQIIGLGIGIDTSNVSLVGFNSSSGIYIYAPGIQHNPVSGDALTVDLSGGPYDANGGSYINVVLARSTVASGAKVLNLIGTTVGHRNVTRFTYVGSAYGDVYLNVPAEFYCTIIAGVLTANQAGTNVVTQYGIGSQTDQSRLNLEGMLFGGGGVAIHGPVNTTNVWRYPMRKIVYLSGDITLGFSDSGYLYVNNTASTYTITLPDTTGQGTPAFLIGYEATFLNYGSGAINFSAAGAASLIGASSLSEIGQRANCTLTIANVWEVDQNLLPVIGSAEVLSNLTGGNAIPIGNSMSDILDYSFDNVQGGILFRSAAAWQFLAAGSAGYVLSTGGVSADPSWIPAGGGGGMTWAGIGGTSQAAAVNTGYVVQNAGQTTVTLPATAPLGSLVSVVGLGAAGWILAANTGQTIQFGGTSTSSGGSFTSVAANDNIQVVCTVADTTWAVLSAVSAGLTPA